MTDDEDEEQPVLPEYARGKWNVGMDDELEWIPDEPIPKKKKKQHKCKFTYCKSCKTYHEWGRGCFIKKLELPKKKEDYRIIVMDFETTQCYQPVPEQMRYLHQVNFVSARVVCTRCIDEGKWQAPINPAHPCEICGYKRNLTWSQRNFTKTIVDENFVSENPLREFLVWLLHNFNKGPTKKFESVVLAHNG